MLPVGQPLTGIRVLVTRPANQQAHFNALLESAGATPLALPLLTITAAPDGPALSSRLLASAPYDLAVFVSPNAVEQAHALLPMPRPTEIAKIVVAVGDATDRKLGEFGRPAQVRPQGEFSSEGLLAEPALTKVAGQRVAIFCGDRGRKMLRDTFISRGAVVDEFVVYRSLTPDYSPDHVCHLLRNNKPDVICITSNQGVENLLLLTDNSCKEALLQTPLIVNSERCSTLASQKGFCAAIVVARTPGDQGQLEGLLQWYTKSHVNHSE